MFVFIPIPYCFNDYSFLILFEIRKYDASSLILPFKTYLPIQGLLRFNINFRIFFFCEKCHWNFNKDCIESLDHFG